MTPGETVSASRMKEVHAEALRSLLVQNPCSEPSLGLSSEAQIGIENLSPRTSCQLTTGSVFLIVVKQPKE